MQTTEKIEKVIRTKGLEGKIRLAKNCVNVYDELEEQASAAKMHRKIRKMKIKIEDRFFS